MPDSSRVPRWQFSLRWLLVAVTLVAVALALGVFGLLSLLCGILLRGVLPTISAICAVYSRGDVRAFAIGAVIAFIPLLVGGTESHNFTFLVGTTLSQALAVGLCGLVAVAVRRWLVKHGLADEN